MDALAYKINEVCRVAKLSRSKLYEDIAAGKLKAKKNGRSTLILGEEIERYLRELPDIKAAA